MAHPVHDAHGPAPPAPRRHPVGARVNLLFLLPFLFAVRAFFGGAGGLAMDLGAFAVLLGAAWLTRDGVLAHAAYDARKVARRPAVPRKLLGSAATGAGLALAGSGSGMADAAIFAVLGGGLHAAAFGPDPLRDKGMDGVDAHQTARATRAVAEAEATLVQMADAIRKAGDRRLIDRVAAFDARVRPLLRAVRDDPRQVSGARRYLGVYLTGARDATIKFAELHARHPDPQARADYEALLDDLEARFAQRRAALLQDDQADLEIEIEVLRDRLAREGVRRDA